MSHPRSSATLSPALRKKFDSLIDWFKERKRVLVAFSGGVDSSLVSAVASLALGDEAIAITANSATLPPWELDEARRVAKEIGIRHITIDVDELRSPDFTKNPPNRCYFCKKELIRKLKEIARELGIKTIVEGTNADDMRRHRPGALALREEGIRSPLAELGITKEEVRKTASFLGLSTADKPSMACLASRIPYGHLITHEKLRRIAEAEIFIRRLTNVRQLRVRDHDGIARIEVGRDERHLLFDEEKMDTIHDKLRSLGFNYVAMDLRGYREGSLDEFIKEPEKGSTYKRKSYPKRSAKPG